MLFWRVIRYFLPWWAAVGTFVSYHVSGFSRTTWVLLFVTTALLLSWPIWGGWLNRKFEQPLIRKEWRQDAIAGRCDILFLRPFAVDRHWHQLREFVMDLVRDYNSRYAVLKSLIAIGRDDEIMATLPSADDEWWSKFLKLSESASAIMILPLAPDVKSASGILEEIVHVIVSYPDKAIFVMPPRAGWDYHLMDTPLAGQLERLWAETVEHLKRKSSALNLLPYVPAGCFWTLHEGFDGHGYETTKYPYNEAGAQKALFAILDEQRIKRQVFAMKYDPVGYARNRLRENLRRTGLPFTHKDPYFDIELNM